MKRITALALTLLLALSLCACGGAKEDASMLGTYTLFAMDYDEKSIVFTDGLFSGENYITLKSGGSAEMCMEDETANVKWKADGGKLTITAADGDMEGSVSGGLLSLDSDGTSLYFAADDAAKSKVKALTLDELLSGAAAEVTNETPQAKPEAPDTPDAPSDEPKAEPTPAPEAPAPTGPSELQQMWNGWYFGCIDMDDCTDEWEIVNGETYDTVMYVELNREGKGRLAIYDSFGRLVSNEYGNIYVQAECHADERYLYADSGTAFGVDLNPSDWIFVRNLNIPEKLHVGSTSTAESGAQIGYTLQFKPWGDRWEGDPYTQFIPYFDAYIGALDAGLTGPFDESFQGFGIAEPSELGGGAAETPAEKPAEKPAQKPAGGHSDLLGANPAVLDVNDRGVVYVYYPADRFRYDDTYGKLKNDDTGVGILIDPMLGDTNFEELKASYEKNNSDEDDYSLVETTVNGYKAMILKYTDWLGATMRVDVDFGGKHGNYYGMSFAVSGDTLADCDTDLVWAIIESMEVAK